jgi:hypothetical protein
MTPVDLHTQFFPMFTKKQGLRNETKKTEKFLKRNETERNEIPVKRKRNGTKFL